MWLKAFKVSFLVSRMIREEYLEEERVKELAKKFRTNKPFSHVVLKNFFKEEFVKKVKGALEKEEFERMDSDLLSFEQTKDLSGTKNEILKVFYTYLNGIEMKEYIRRLTNKNVFGKVDASGFVYCSGDYLLPHDDCLEKRRVAFVLTLTDLEEEDGGSLDFFKGKKKVRSFISEENMFILFEVRENKSVHQVAEILREKERVSIGGWFNGE